tara:strand:+ start:208 stop:462 length:255 start_codon:yes stop_codon:yes gene_type:complete
MGSEWDECECGNEDTDLHGLYDQVLEDIQSRSFVAMCDKLLAQLSDLRIFMQQAEHSFARIARRQQSARGPIQTQSESAKPSTF